MSDKYAYLGPAGTFTEMAVLKYCHPVDEILPFRTINEVITRVKEGKVDKGIIPLENSLEGSVNLSLDLLFKEPAIKIIGEVIVPIEHYLYVAPGVKLHEIKEILSHPQAIAQAGDYIYHYLPEAKITYTDSTAAAAEKVIGSKHKGMIGSRRINEIYNLKIIAENVEGGTENHTRFAVISKSELDFMANAKYKTSLVCTPDVNRPGVLFEMLSEFANRNINLTKIESRPTKKKLGEYLFYIDMEGHESENKIKKALTAIKAKSGLFKILGSYIQDNIKKELTKEEGNKVLKEEYRQKSTDAWKKIVRKELKQIKPYIPGKPIAEVQKEYNLEKVVKLASNENPLGVSPLVEKTITDEMTKLNRYPDGGSSLLKTALSKKIGIKEDMILFGNGSDGLLKVIAESFLDTESEVITSHPTFVEYIFVSQLMGSRLIRVWMKDYKQNLLGIANAVTSKTKMIFLTNPHNPAGTIFSREDLELLLKHLPDDIIVVLDEAYYEYVQSADYPDGLHYVKQGYPVIVLRTFSKAYGLAGLRLGYALAQSEIISTLNKAKDPFNVNHLAEMAGKAALDDQEFLNKTKTVNETGKKYLYKEFKRLGLEYVPTEANFILVKVDRDSMELFQNLLEKGVIIRPGKPLGYCNHIRVTVGTQAENEAFIKALELTL